MVTVEGEPEPVIRRLPASVYVPSRFEPSKLRETFCGSGGFARLPDDRADVVELIEICSPEAEEVSES